MSRTMRQRLVLITVAALALASCGGGDDENIVAASTTAAATATTEGGDFVEEIDGICADFNDAGDELDAATEDFDSISPDASDFQLLENGFGDVVDLLDTEEAKIDALDVPAEAEDAIATIQQSFDDLRAGVQDIIDAAADQDLDAVEEAVQDLENSVDEDALDDASQELADLGAAQCDPDLDDSSSDDSSDESSSSDSGSVDQDFLDEVDAVCADTADVLLNDVTDSLDGLEDLVAAGDLDTVASELGDASAALDEVLLRFDDLDTPEEASLAVNNIIIFLGDFSTQINDVAQAASAGDSAGVTSAAASFSVDTADANEAAQTLTDLGASECAQLG